MTQRMREKRRLEEKREKLLERARRIAKDARSEGRSNLTRDEESRFHDLMDRADEIREELLDYPAQEPIARGAFESHSDGGGKMESNEIQGVTPDGKVVRSYGPGDSIYEDRKASGEYEHDFWDDMHIGTYLRAREFGPRNDVERRALDTVNASAVVPQPLQDQVVDDIREGSLLGQLSIRSVPMESKTLDIAKFDSAPSGAWLDEGSTFSSTDPSIGSVQLQARTFRARVDVSRESFDDSVGLDEALRRAFRQEFVGELNSAILVGGGSTSEPTGVANTTDIPTTAFGGSTDGVRPASSGSQWDEVIRARQQLLDREVSPGNLEGVWSPKASRLFNSLTDANFQPLRRPQVIRDLRIAETVASPTTLQATTGSANVGMELTLGDWSNVAVGVRLDPEIRVIDAKMKDSWEMSFIAGARWDVQFLHADALERLRPITT